MEDQTKILQGMQAMAQREEKFIGTQKANCILPNNVESVSWFWNFRNTVFNEKSRVKYFVGMGINKYTDITTLRMNQPNGQFTENIKLKFTTRR